MHVFHVFVCLYLLVVIAIFIVVVICARFVFVCHCSGHVFGLLLVACCLLLFVCCLLLFVFEFCFVCLFVDAVAVDVCPFFVS